MRRRRPSPAASGRPAENGRRGRDRRFPRRFGLRRHRRHDPRQGARIPARGDVHLQGHSLWSAHLRRPALHGAGAAGAVDRRSLGARLGVREPADSARALGQGRGGLRLRMESRRAGRRLPAPERLDARPRRPQARRHGLVARRRLRHRLRQRDERLRRREPRAPRCRRRQPQPPRRRGRLPRPLVDRRREVRGVGKRRVCSTSSPRSSGCGTTSRASAAIPRT